MKTQKTEQTTQLIKIVSEIKKINIREPQSVNESHDQLIIRMIPYSQCFLIA